MSSRVFRKDARKMAEVLHRVNERLANAQQQQAFCMVLEEVIIPFLEHWNPNTDRKDFRKAVYEGTVYAKQKNGNSDE